MTRRGAGEGATVSSHRPSKSKELLLIHCGYSSAKQNLYDTHSIIGPSPSNDTTYFAVTNHDKIVKH